MRNNDKFPPLTQDVIDGLKMGVFDDDVGWSLLRIWQLGACDPKIAGMIQHRVSREKLTRALSSNPFMPPKLRHGDLVLGFDQDGRPILIPLQYLNAHCLTVGGSGTGKTTKTKFYALQIAQRVSGMWLIDLRKRELGVLRPLLCRVGINLIVAPARMLRINPLQVPLDVEPTDWVPRVADMLIEVLELPPRASKLMQTALFRLYRQFGVLDGAELYPTLYDLCEAIKEDREANPPARQAIIDSLEPVLFSLGPEVLGYRYGWASHELARRHIVFEFGGISETDKNLLINSLMLSEFTSRVARGISNPQLDLLIVVDEAQRLCSSSYAASGHSSAIGDLIGLIRGTGIGLDLSVLSTANLMPQVISNSATKIMGRCGSADDYAVAGHSMGLTAEQIQWAQLHLKPGFFIGQLGEGEWRHPFVFQIPPMKPIASEAQNSSCDDMEPLTSLPVVRSEENRG